MTFATGSHVSELSTLVSSPARAAGPIAILRDGEAAFAAMLELIGAARSRVSFENFIFAGDGTGRRFAEALTAAAARGVDVRVLYDPIGTLMVRGGSIARVLRTSGVRLRSFRPLSPYAPWSWTRVRHRDHRKSLCVDGEVAVVGGLCISDNWSPSSRGGRGWRDTALRVEGAVVGDVERAFDALWTDTGASAAGVDGALATSTAGAPVAPPPGLGAPAPPGATTAGRGGSWPRGARDFF